jgi:triosephosphate isomerase
MAMKKIIIANWKMKLTLEESLKLAKKVKDKFKSFKDGDIAVCPSPIALSEVRDVLYKSKIAFGSQNVFWEDLGAYTGEISPAHLIELGCKYVIIGHSERRKYLIENYEMIHKKIKAVINTGKLIPVVCIGENWEERKTEKRDFVLVDQLQQALSGLDIMGEQEVIVAYEPIWAIGTGTAIEPSEAEYAHKIIKLALNDIFGMQTVSKNFKIIYGGSINSKNVGGFANLEGIDGLLVGSASLDAEEFYKVAKSITKAKK